MPEDTFRIVVTVAVALACLAFVIQAYMVLALYKTVRKMQAKVGSLVDRADPVIARIGPALDQMDGSMNKIGPVLDRMGPVVDQVKATVEKVRPVLDAAVPVVRKAGETLDEARAAIVQSRDAIEKAGEAMEKAGAAAEKAGVTAVQAGAAIEKAGPILERAREIADENAPRIAEVTKESVAIARSARETVGRAGAIVQEIGGRAKERVAQIDESVGNTVEQAGQVGEAMKRAVMKPVREVNGIAAGVSAAVSTMVRGSRKSSVDLATQDEEMFI